MLVLEIIEKLGFSVLRGRKVSFLLNRIFIFIYFMNEKLKLKIVFSIMYFLF